MAGRANRYGPDRMAEPSPPTSAGTPGASDVGSSTGPGVLAVLPRGEAIRNHVYSGGLDAVAAEVRLAVQSVVPSPELGQHLAERYGPITPLPPLEVPRSVGLARGLVAEAHNRQLWSAAAQDRHRRRRIQAGSRSAELKARAWQALGRPFASPRGVRAVARIEQRISARQPAPAVTTELFDRFDPTLVFNGSHVHAENAVATMHEARRRSIPTATFLFSWDNLTSQGRITPPYDHYLVWNDEIGRDLRRIYPDVRADQVTVTGTPQFDPHFWADQHLPPDELRRRIGADPDRPLVLYSTGMPNHMPHEDEIVADLARRLGERTDLGRPQVVLRVYAKDRTGRFEHLRGTTDDLVFMPVLWEPRWHTPLPEDTVLWSSTLAAVACGVNVASTVSLELAMFDHPVVNVGYSPPSLREPGLRYERYYDFDHYKPLVTSGAVTLASSPDDLVESLATALRDPAHGRPQRTALLERMFGTTLDGRSHHRIATTLTHLATP